MCHFVLSESGLVVECNVQFFARGANQPEVVLPATAVRVVPSQRTRCARFSILYCLSRYALA